MTVIACRNGIVAADTGSSYGDIFHGRASKIHRLSDGSIFAAAGWKPVIERALDWLDAGADPGKRPEKADKDDLEGLVLLPSGRVWSITYTFDYYESDEHEFVVCGSHHEFLIGAMRAGASAEAAVALAIKYCRYASGDVETMRLE